MTQDMSELKCSDCVHYKPERKKGCGRCTVSIPPWVGWSSECDDALIDRYSNYAWECVFYKAKGNEQDICGLCGLGGANKIPHPIHWPGERKPDTEFVHDECEAVECKRAHAALTDSERVQFLASIQ